MQLKRFHDRAHDRLKTWKLSPMDIAALNKWTTIRKKRDRMLKETDTEHAPWTVVRANDKRRARIEIIRSILTALDYRRGQERRRRHRLAGSSVRAARSRLTQGAARGQVPASSLTA